MPRDDEFRALAQRHGSVVERYLRSTEMDPEVREEHWSEVFTIAFRRLDDLQDLSDTQARGWLLATARNVTRNGARRAISRRHLVDRLSHEPIVTATSAEDDYLRWAGDLDRVRAAWSTLSGTHQQVLMLSMEGADGQTISNTLDITCQAARSRLMRARAAFLDAYERCGATP